MNLVHAAAGKSISTAVVLEISSLAQDESKLSSCGSLEIINTVMVLEIFLSV